MWHGLILGLCQNRAVIITSKGELISLHLHSPLSQLLFLSSPRTRSDFSGGGSEKTKTPHSCLPGVTCQYLCLSLCCFSTLFPFSLLRTLSRLSCAFHGQLTMWVSVLDFLYPGDFAAGDHRQLTLPLPWWLTLAAQRSWETLHETSSIRMSQAFSTVLWLCVAPPSALSDDAVTNTAPWKHRCSKKNIIPPASPCTLRIFGGLALQLQYALWSLGVIY